MKKNKVVNKRLYRVWANIVQRCTNPNHPRFAHYGGRGITICEEWRKSYREFERWALKNGYFESEKNDHQCTIDRINNDMGYSPDNCRFVNNRIQSNNRSNNQNLTCNGETHTIQEWARIMNIHDYIIRDRLWKLKWSVEKAILTPIRVCKGGN